jgi:hypothetical protein
MVRRKAIWPWQTAIARWRASPRGSRCWRPPVWSRRSLPGGAERRDVVARGGVCRSCARLGRADASWDDPIDDVVGALEAFASPLERVVDLAFVNDRVFVNNVSLGDYAEIVQSEAYRDAKLGTTAKMLPQLLGPNATPFDLRFLGPHGRTERSAQLLLVSNDPYALNALVGDGSGGDVRVARGIAADPAVRRVERMVGRRVPGRFRLTARSRYRRRGRCPRAACDRPPLRFRLRRM